MKLAELEPQFLRHEEKLEKRMYQTKDGRTEEREELQTYHVYEDELSKAQGIMFLCPECFKKNNGPVGTHSVICWFRDRGVPADAFPLPGRWVVTGTTYEDLTLSPSVLLTDGCRWHGFVTGGMITQC